MFFKRSTLTTNRQLVAVLLLLLAVLLAPLSAQTLDPSITSQKAAQAIRDCGSVYARNHASATDLQQLGYKPASDQLWRVTPPLRQVEAAYIAAENAAPGRGGDQMLALLSQDLAQHYGKDALPESLQPYLKVAAQRPNFTVKPRYAMADGPVTTASAAGMQSLNKYLQGSGLGGPSAILRDYLGLPPEVANDILTTSPDISEAFKRAINWVPEQQRLPRLNRIVADVDSLYGAAARSDAGLDAFRPHVSAPPPPPPSSAASAGPMIALPPAPPALRERVAPPSYSRFVETNYKPAEMVFGEMIAIEGGFGGVVFGADVKPDPALGKLNSVQWVADPADNAQGKLQLQFDRAGVRTWGPVEYEDALAAMKMVSGGSEFPQWKPGDGIGLVGLDVDNSGQYISCGPDCQVDRERRWNVILHPALANRDLGWAAIMVDTLPTNDVYFEKLAHGKVEDKELDRLLHWEGSNPGNYKFVDLPMRISSGNGSSLAVLPSSSGQPAGSGPVFLSVKPFGDPERGRKFAGDFPAVAPTLLKISVYHEHLNRFAPVLGIMRLAKSSGATITVAGGTLKTVATPGSVAIPDSGVVPLPAFDPAKSTYAEDRAALEAYLMKLINELPDAARSKLMERRLALQRLQENQEKASAAAAQVGKAINDYDTWRERTSNGFKAQPKLEREFDGVADDVLQSLKSISEQPGGEAFSVALNELIQAQQHLHTWLVKFAPDLAEPRKQADTRLVGLARTAAGFYDRIDEIEDSIGDENELHRELIAVLPDSVRSAYDGFIQQSNSASDRAALLDKESDELRDSIDNPARLQKAIDAAPAAAQRLIRDARARADALAKKSRETPVDKSDPPLYLQIRKADEEVEQLQEKYLTAWAAENQQISDKADAKDEEVAKATKDALAAGADAAKVLNSAYPKLACIENLLAWFNEDQE